MKAHESHDHQRTPDLEMRRCASTRRRSGWASGDPRAIDFSRDVEDTGSAWTSGSGGCSSSVRSSRRARVSRLDLLPLIMVVADERRLEEELFLTTLPLGGVASTSSSFRRVLDEVAGAAGDDLHRYHTPSYKTISTRSCRPR